MQRKRHQKKPDLRGFFFITRLRRLTIAANTRSDLLKILAYSRPLRKLRKSGMLQSAIEIENATAKRLEGFDNGAAANHRIAHVGNERLTGSSRLARFEVRRAHQAISIN